jgi:hypothetical protein
MTTETETDDADADAPIVQCREEGGRFAFDCPHCGHPHMHSPEPGYRRAHCTDRKSPYRRTGYVLSLSPPAAEPDGGTIR